MLIRITAIDVKTNKTLSREHTTDYAVNLARTALLKLQPMDETSADIMALNLINKVENGSRQTIEHATTKNTLTFERI